MLVTVVLGFAAVAMLVAALVIANTFQVLVAQRTRTLALLRCVGASKRQLRRSVLLEAAILGFGSALVGLVRGAVLAQVALIVAQPRRPRRPAAVEHQLTPAVVLVPLLVGTLVTVLASLVPAREATRVAPIAALRPADAPAVGARAGRIRLAVSLLLVVGGAGVLLLAALAAPARRRQPSLLLGVGILAGAASFVGVLLGAVFWVPRIVALLGRALASTGTSARLAAANTVRNPRRTAATSTALLIGVTLVVMMSTGAASARTSMDRELDERYPVDLVVDGPARGRLVRDGRGRRPAGASRRARRPRTVAAAHRRGPDGQLGDRRRGRRRRRRARRPCSATLARRRPADGILLLPASAKDRDLPTGDAVSARPTTTTATPAPAGRRCDSRAVSTGLGGDRRSSPARRSTRSPRRPRVDHVGVARPRADPADVMQDVRDALPDGALEVSSAAQQRVSNERLVDSLLGIVVGLLAVAVVIALIGVANTLSLSVLERRRESATLRAIGLSRRQLRWMLAVEGMLIAGVGALLGAGLGLLYGWAGSVVVFGTWATCCSLCRGATWSRAAGRGGRRAARVGAARAEGRPHLTGGGPRRRLTRPRPRGRSPARPQGRPDRRSPGHRRRVRLTLLHPDPERGAGTVTTDVEVVPGHGAGRPATRAGPAQRPPGLGSSAHRLAVADQVLDESHVAGQAPLVHGCVLGLGPVARPSAEEALRVDWHVAVVAGPDCGVLVGLPDRTRRGRRPGLTVRRRGDRVRARTGRRSRRWRPGAEQTSGRSPTPCGRAPRPRRGPRPPRPAAGGSDLADAPARVGGLAVAVHQPLLALVGLVGPLGRRLRLRPVSRPARGRPRPSRPSSPTPPPWSRRPCGRGRTTNRSRRRCRGTTGARSRSSGRGRSPCPWPGPSCWRRSARACTGRSWCAPGARRTGRGASGPIRSARPPRRRRGRGRRGRRRAARSDALARWRSVAPAGARVVLLAASAADVPAWCRSRIEVSRSSVRVHDPQGRVSPASAARREPATAEAQVRRAAGLRAALEARARRRRPGRARRSARDPGSHGRGGGGRLGPAAGGARRGARRWRERAPHVGRPRGRRPARSGRRHHRRRQVRAPHDPRPGAALTHPPERLSSCWSTSRAAPGWARSRSCRTSSSTSRTSTPPRAPGAQRAAGRAAAPRTAARGRRRARPRRARPPLARPPSRLLVVVDELRALTEDVPEAAAALARLAAQGRALGVHLVLATQRPAGAIGADLRANVSLRIALRVADAADSTDVLDVADAAASTRARPVAHWCVAAHARSRPCRWRGPRRARGPTGAARGPVGPSSRQVDPRRHRTGPTRHRRGWPPRPTRPPPPVRPPPWLPALPPASTPGRRGRTGRGAGRRGPARGAAPRGRPLGSLRRSPAGPRRTAFRPVDDAA